MGDLAFDLLGSHNVKSNGAVGLPIYEFLLIPNSKHMSKSHLRVIAIRKNLLSLIITPRHPQTHPFPWEIFFSKNRIASSVGQREASHQV